MIPYKTRAVSDLYQLSKSVASSLAIEPMVMVGSDEILELDDGWTIITEDGSKSAHYENTILITENEPEILTLL